ncbi:MAG: GTPase ObgE [Dehalococcoidia bacterium]|nr:GTPase ObgE [Dehalococcoidia bacterium]
MIDTTRISVKAGDGGNGCVSFRREKFVPRGGPDGGDGGPGGNIFLYGDPSLNTLLHLKYHSTWRAQRGGHGGGQNRKGANGRPISIPVPLGTVVRSIGPGREETFLADITDTSPILVAQGGEGGQGNARFATATRQEPVLAERGAAGEKHFLSLELKLLADVGLVGKPNAGKSTLLSVCSAAKPKIAPYPFTTLDPVLGVVQTRDRSYVVMEVPGLIEGAHTGAGLGHEFLRHAERSRLLLHLVDGTSEDPLADVQQLNQELSAFDADLGSKPQVLVVTKMDIPEAKEGMSRVKGALEPLDCPVFFISAASGEGVDTLLSNTLGMLDAIPKDMDVSESAEIPLASPRSRRRWARDFRVYREGKTYVVEALRIERLLDMADLKDWRAMVQVWKELETLGAVKALEEQGVQPGDTVRIGDVELEWY